MIEKVNIVELDVLNKVHFVECAVFNFMIKTQFETVNIVEFQSIQLL